MSEGRSTNAKVPLDLEALGNRWADRPAVIFPSDALSFAGLAERVLACARDLAGHGVSAGDRIGVVCGLDADTVVSILAAQELGCVLLPLGADAPSAARERVLATFRPAWVVDGGEPSAVGSSAVTSGGPEVLALTSSGSTGAPKLALVTASQLRARADLYIRRCRLSSDDRTLMIYPPHHAGGMHALLVSLSVGSALVFPASAHPRTVVRTCAEQGVTCLPGPATLFELLVRHRSNDWPSLPCLRFARSGTANLPLETHRAFTEGFQIPLWHSYGASEAGPICVNRSGAAHDGRLALGAPLAGVEVRVCDEHGAEVDDGEVGELVVDSPGVALAYAGPAQEGSRIEHGRFFTGDRGHRIGGLFYFRGRSKLLINVAGHKVDPAVVEDQLRSHPSVQDVAVVAHATPSRDVVKAIIVARESVGIEALTDFCSRALAPHEIPRFVEFRRELPRNALGKLQRERL